jgi:hypothetical protein
MPPTTKPSASASGSHVGFRRCGLSQHALARETGISREYLDNIERDRIHP